MTHEPECTCATVADHLDEECLNCTCEVLRRAYQRGLAKWVEQHTGDGQPDDDSDTRQWCECGATWPCFDYKMARAAGWEGE